MDGFSADSLDIRALTESTSEPAAVKSLDQKTNSEPARPVYAAMVRRLSAFTPQDLINVSLFQVGDLIICPYLDDLSEDFTQLEDYFYRLESTVERVVFVDDQYVAAVMAALPEVLKNNFDMRVSLRAGLEDSEGLAGRVQEYLAHRRQKANGKMSHAKVMVMIRSSGVLPFLATLAGCSCPQYHVSFNGIVFRRR